MSKLDNKDLAAAVAFSGEILETTDLQTFPGRALAALRGLVPCEVAVYREVERPGRDRTVSDPPLGRRSEACAARLTIQLPAQAPTIASIDLHRQAAFTLRERQLIELARPHLCQAYENALACSRLKQITRILGLALEGGESGVLVVSSSDRVRFASDRARRLLARHESVIVSEGSQLPAGLSHWLERERRLPDEPHRGFQAVDSLHASGASRLSARRLPAQGREPSLVLLQEDAGEAGRLPETLTSRERDVLRCLLAGGSDAEIAGELALSVRTVQKHLEHVYEKLQVRGRAAAISYVAGLAV
jgi:DNA-binding CsgD family transcriptional regulator